MGSVCRRKIAVMALGNDLVRFNIESASEEGTRELEGALQRKGVEFLHSGAFIAVDRTNKDLVRELVKKILQKYPAALVKPGEGDVEENSWTPEENSAEASSKAPEESQVETSSKAPEESQVETSSKVPEGKSRDFEVPRQRMSDRIMWWYIYCVLVLPFVLLPACIVVAVVFGEDVAGVFGIIIASSVPVSFVIGAIWSNFD